MAARQPQRLSATHGWLPAARVCQSFHGHPGHAYPVQFTNKLITFSYARSPGGRNVLNRAGSGCLAGWCRPRQQQQHGRHDAVSSHPVRLWYVIIYSIFTQVLLLFFFLFFSSSFSFFLFFFNRVLFPVSSRFYFPFQSDSTPFFIQVLFPFSIRFYSLFHPGSISLFNQILLPFSSRFYFPFQSDSTPFFIQVLLPFHSGSTPFSIRFYCSFQSGCTPFSVRFDSPFNQVLLPLQSDSAPFSIGFCSFFNRVWLPSQSGSLLFSGNQVSQAVHPFSIRLFSPFSQSPFYTPLYIKVVFSFSIALI